MTLQIKQGEKWDKRPSGPVSLHPKSLSSDLKILALFADRLRVFDANIGESKERLRSTFKQPSDLTVKEANLMLPSSVTGLILCSVGT